VTWEEVEKCLKKKDPNLLVFDSAQVLARVAKMGDIFEPVLTLKQRLPNVTELGGGRTEPTRSARAKSAAEPKSKMGQKKSARRSAKSHAETAVG
jgi:bifunctional non-homologous end joining protein LigD